MRVRAVPGAKSVAHLVWVFRVHAVFVLLAALLLLSTPWLGRGLRIATFGGTFLFAITGFSVLIVALAVAGADSGVAIDGEVTGWLLILLVAAGVSLGIFLFVSPIISVERLGYFLSIHALALGFLEVRLAQRLRRHRRQFQNHGEVLRGFGAASTTFFLLLLMPALYGERFGIVVVAAYCLFFALELVMLPSKLRQPANRSDE
ncbi:MAG TPA: hypothetical protein VFN53_00690 [Acidobacteriaceae bacterium]|nr:hypothetical protein [Acidobacteriaceae bacterium]